MPEFVKNAWLGWMNYTDKGKLAALVIAAVVYLLLRKQRGAAGRLTIYTGVMTLLCICPLTAAILMVYQTRFYDYQWIWSMVPVTAMIALGGTVFLMEQWKSGIGWKTVGRNIFVTLASIALLVLCSGLGEGSVDSVKAKSDRTHAELVLNEALRNVEGEVCLWAPANLLEYARPSRDVTLLYGRNMWDEALNAYSYDTYTEEQRALYQWMEELTGKETPLSAAETKSQVKKALGAGANCIVIPTSVSQSTSQTVTEDAFLEQMSSDLNVEIVVFEGYYLITG